MDLTAGDWAIELLDDGAGTLNRPIEGTRLTLAYDGARVSGTAGCNRFFGPASLEDEVRIGPLASTMMFCAAPEGVMDQEQRFLGLLGDVDTIHLTDETIELGRGNRVVIVMNRSNVGLAGEWSLLFYNNGTALVSPIAGVAVTARFNEGVVEGEGGCNRYRATYESDGSSLRISPPIATRMACPEPDLMEQETVFLQLLAQTSRYVTRDGRLLDLYDGAGGRILQFDRS